MHSQCLFSTVLEFLTSATKQEKEIKSMQIGKKKLILYRDINPKNLQGQYTEVICISIYYQLILKLKKFKYHLQQLKKHKILKINLAKYKKRPLEKNDYILLKLKNM